MRWSLLAFTVLAPSIAVASASGGFTPGHNCPSPACSDRIDVRLNAPRGHGAVFVAILPIEGNKPTLPGAWLIGTESLSISAVPIPAKIGEIGPYKARFRIPGGVCAVASQKGVSGTFGLYAGYGQAPAALVASIETLERRVAAAEPEVQTRANEALRRLQSLNPVANAAAENMLANQTFWPITTINCP